MRVLSAMVNIFFITEYSWWFYFPVNALLHFLLHIFLPLVRSILMPCVYRYLIFVYIYIYYISLYAVIVLYLYYCIVHIFATLSLMCVYIFGVDNYELVICIYLCIFCVYFPSSLMDYVFI